MVGVGEEFHIGGREQPHLEANLKRDDPLEQRLQGHALEDRRRQLRELAIGLDESVQRFGAVLDNGEAALQIALQDGDGRRGRWGRRGCSVDVRLSAVRRFEQDTRTQRARDGFDGRERVADLVTDDADEAAPRKALLLAQSGADVG